jgi:hypothetical protein
MARCQIERFSCGHSKPSKEIGVAFTIAVADYNRWLYQIQWYGCADDSQGISPNNYELILLERSEETWLRSGKNSQR